MGIPSFTELSWGKLRSTTTHGFPEWLCAMSRGEVAMSTLRGFEEKGPHVALRRHSLARKELTTSGRERAEPGGIGASGS